MLKALPVTLLQAPALCVIHAAALVLINQMEAAQARLQAAEQAVQQEPLSDQAHIILGWAATVRGNLVRFSGDLARSAALSHQALDLLLETEFMWIIARLNAAYAFLINSEVTPALERHLAEVIQLIRPAAAGKYVLRRCTFRAGSLSISGSAERLSCVRRGNRVHTPDETVWKPCFQLHKKRSCHGTRHFNRRHDHQRIL